MKLTSLSVQPSGTVRPVSILSGHTSNELRLMSSFLLLENILASFLPAGRQYAVRRDHIYRVSPVLVFSLAIKAI